MSQDTDTQDSNVSFWKWTEGLFCNRTLNSVDKNTTIKTRQQYQKFFHEESILSRTHNCKTYFHTMPVLENLQPSSKKVAEFPLAFSHLVHHEAGLYLFAPLILY